MMLDLHEGILEEFAERSAMIRDVDDFGRHANARVGGFGVVDPGRQLRDYHASEAYRSRQEANRKARFERMKADGSYAQELERRRAYDQRPDVKAAARERNRVWCAKNRKKAS